MTAAHAHNETVHAPPHAQALICGSATLIAHVYGWLTAITLAGEIDATNADQVSDQAVKLVPEDSALIVDMDGVDFIGVDGLRALLAMNLECIRTDTRWAVITSHAVDRLLRVGDRAGLVPAVRSATEALQLVRRPARGRGPLTLVRSAG